MNCLFKQLIRLVRILHILKSIKSPKVMKRQILKISGVMLLAAGMFMACNDATNADVADNEQQVQDSIASHENKAVATITATGEATAVTGSAIFAQDGNETRLTLSLNIPSKAGQTVAVHIHEHGDCGAMADHAGGHWNPTGTDHGKWGEGSFHSGDIGNIQLDAEGNASFELSSNLWSVGGDSTTDILNKTIIIHEGVDDYTSQPSGNSGARIGCGIITQSGTTDFAASAN